MARCLAFEMWMDALRATLAALREKHGPGYNPVIDGFELALKSGESAIEKTRALVASGGAPSSRR